MTRSALRFSFPSPKGAAGAAVAASLLCSAAFTVPVDAAEGSAPKVVASIKPIHSLVASVMEGVGTPDLLVEGAASPHTYSMKPSDAAALQDADVVFWAGEDLEAFLVKPVATLATNAEVVELVDAPGLKKLPLREGGPFEAHDDEDAMEGHDGAARAGADHDRPAGTVDVKAEADHDEDDQHGGTDMHFWLDPVNAKVMAATIETTLASADPAHAATYRANADRLDARLDALIATTAAELRPVAEKSFIVFHDAYHYFEQRFGVTAAGSITVSPDQQPGVRRIAAIQAKLKELGAICVFAEPQFEPKLVSVVTENTSARSGVLDPEGAALKDGPDLYFQLIGNLATSLKSCLSQGS